MAKKSHFDLAREYLQEYFDINKVVPDPMIIIEWRHFISRSVGRTPNVISEVTKLLEAKKIISIANGKVIVNHRYFAPQPKDPIL